MPLKLSKDCKYLYDTDQRTKLEANCKQEMNFAEQEMFSELEKCYKKPTRTECKGQMNTFYRSARSKPNNCTKALERIVKICGANLSANEQCYKDHWSEFETTCNLKTIQDDKYDTGMTNKIIKKNKSNIHNNKYNNVSTDKNNQLIEAVKKGSLSDVQAALANGADVNAKDNQEGATALKYASLENRTDIAKLLLDRGADINAKDKYGATALMSASIGNSRREVLKLLLDRGADVNAKDNKGYTALNHAKNMFWMETVKTLEKAGAKE
jgi:hypothetical protein